MHLDRPVSIATRQVSTVPSSNWAGGFPSHSSPRTFPRQSYDWQYSHLQASWAFYLRCYPFMGNRCTLFNPLVTMFKSPPFPPDMFYCISIISTMAVSDSLPRQCCFVSLSTLSPTVSDLRRSFPVGGRVSQVALMSFGTCHL